MRKPGTWRILAAILILASLLAGCGGSAAKGGAPSSAPNQQKVKLTVWYWNTSPEIEKLLKTTADRFIQQNPDVESVDWVYFANADMNTKITAGLTTGSLPDIAWLSANQVKDFARSKYAVNISKEFPDAWAKMKQGFYDSWLPFGEVDGQMFAPPIVGSIMGVIINKDIFDKAGITKYPESWAEFTDVARRLTVVENGKTTQYGLLFWGPPYTKFPWALFEYHFLYPNNIIPISSDGKTPRYNTPEAVEALQLLNDWVNKYKVTEVGGPAIADTFLAGKAAMVLGEVGHLGDYSAKATFKLDATHSPTKDGKPRGMISGQNLMLFNTDRSRLDAAWRLEQFLLTDKQWLTDFITLTGNFSARKDVMESDSYKQYLESHPALKHLAEGVPNGVPRLTFPGQTEIMTVLGSKVEETLLGQTTPQAALDAVQAEAVRILKEKNQ